VGGQPHGGQLHGVSGHYHKGGWSVTQEVSGQSIGVSGQSLGVSGQSHIFLCHNADGKK